MGLTKGFWIQFSGGHAEYLFESGSFASWVDFRGMGKKAFEEAVAFNSFGESFFSIGGKFVVFAGWALFALGDGGLFPFGVDEAGLFKTAEGGVDGSAWESGYVHDIEAVLVAVCERLKNGRGGVR